MANNSMKVLEDLFAEDERRDEARKKEAERRRPLMPGEMRMMDADGNVTIRQGRVPEPGQVDNTTRATVPGMPTFSEARLAEMGYTPETAPDYLRPGSSGGTMRMMSAREQLGGGPVTASERAEARRIRGQSPTFGDVQMALLKNQREMRMMTEAGQTDRQRIATAGQVAAAQISRPAAPKEDAPKPVVGAAGAVIPDGKGGWKFDKVEPPTPSPVVSPGSTGYMVDDPNSPGGKRFVPFKEEPTSLSPIALRDDDNRIIGYQEFNGTVRPLPRESASGARLGVTYEGEGGMTPGGNAPPSVPPKAAAPPKSEPKAGSADPGKVDPLEGKTATRKSDGARIVYRNGKWVDM